jgi:hypothetical protein
LSATSNGDLKRLLRELEQGWTQYSEMLQSITPEANTDSTPMSDMLETWWKNVRGSADSELESLFEPLVHHAQVLFRLTDRLILNNAQNQKGDTDLNSLLLEHLQVLNDSLNSATLIHQDITTPLSHLVSLWNETVQDITGIPQQGLMDWAESARIGKPEKLEELIKLLRLPDSSHFTEQQELLENLISCLSEYQNTYQSYVLFGMRVTSDSIEEMQRKLSGTRNLFNASYSTVDFYSEWLATCESIYQNSVQSPDYHRLVAALIEKAVKVKNARQQLVDKAAGWLGLPNQQQQTAMIRTMSSIRKDVRILSRLKTKPTSVQQADPIVGPKDSLASTGNEPKIATNQNIEVEQKITRKKIAVKVDAQKKVAVKADSKKKVAVKVESKKKVVVTVESKKKVAAKAGARKKVTAKVGSRKKVAVKIASKKKAAKKSSTKKISTSKVGATKSVTKKSVAKKSTTKKTSKKKISAKKSITKKSSAKKRTTKSASNSKTI